MPLMGSVLNIWLAELGMSKSLIGSLAFFHFPYTFRILWAPIIDHVPCPLLSSLGRRKGWLILSLGLTMMCLMAMGWLGSSLSITAFAGFACLISFFSGCTYMVSVAYEMECLEKDQYPIGSASVIVGYRIGLLLAGAGTLYLAHYYSWAAAYQFVGIGMLGGIIAILLQPEPQHGTSVSDPKQSQNAFQERPFWQKIWLIPYESVWKPFIQFIQQPNWLLVLIFISLYRLSDDLAHAMLGPFYIEMGFSKADIANASKLFGMAATCLGGMIAGSCYQFIEQKKALFLFGCMHALSYLCYLLLAIYPQPSCLYLAVLAEHLTGGMVMTGFIAFLWSLCHSQYSASQFVLLRSFITFKHTCFACLGGVFVDYLGWHGFFILLIALFVPGLFALLNILRTPAARYCENA